MGLLSTLGTIAGFIPLPGMNALGKGLQMAGSAGDVLGKQQQGAAQGQLSQAQLQQGQDRNAIDLYQAQQGAQNQAAQTDLNRKTFESQNRGTTAKQALLASLLGGDYQGANVSVPGITNANVSGGLLASLKNSPGAMAAMQRLAQQASTAQTTPLAFQGGQAIAAPALTALPKASKSSNFLNVLARIAQLGGAVGPMLSQNQNGNAPGNGGDWGGYG